MRLALAGLGIAEPVGSSCLLLIKLSRVLIPLTYALVKLLRGSRDAAG